MTTVPPPNTSPQQNLGPNVNQADERPDVDISPLLSRLQFNPVVSQFISQQPLVKATIFRAISESFADVVPPVILSTSNVASISTKELILKDFATEPDEMKLKRAAYSMIQPLVGNLAVATCKETLCNAMSNSICEDLIQAGLPKVNLKKKTIK
jgi:CCR4-NOT transcription complex subunit 1